MTLPTAAPVMGTAVLGCSNVQKTIFAPLTLVLLALEVLLFAQFAYSAVLLLQVISLFAFAFGVNVCMGFTTNRFRRSEEWDEGPVSGTVTDVNCTSQCSYVICCG